MQATIQRSTPIRRSPRVLQLEGLFELPPTERSDRGWTVTLPLEARPWNIGLITGPSGCGKTTIARQLFGPALAGNYSWPTDASIVDAFPAGMGIKEITGLLASVGFSSPPSWLRPFAALSNGEQFRVALARALAEAAQPKESQEHDAALSRLVVIDEFTSVVDRTVARIGSAAVAKAVRQQDLRLVAVSCHDDIEAWLQPDWVFEPAGNAFQWRELCRRPPLALEVRRVDPAAWKWFKHHHYLDARLHPAARCFVGWIESRPAVFTAVLPFPHATRPGWREHRTVCLPDFQGVGIGNRMSEFVASLFRATGRPYRSVTSNPAMIAHRARADCWTMTRPPARTRRQSLKGMNRTAATYRFTASFEYIGPPRPTEARRFGLFENHRQGGSNR